ncbi:putative nuclease HARBI1 [Belonocnema kinseyi]|uniref:putative nuclease HARBI1 n=1 Tax=Belonocnema kinseyi TaxID=2817044 RepID=UPI00143D5319|nr:putative nuclease HARBI1 [Belonocnema kinseyi]
MALFYDDILPSSNDDEMLNHVQRRPQIFRERVNYFETMDDLDFFTRFRLTEITVETLLIQIEESLIHATERNNAIPPRIQLLLALRYYATGWHLIAAGDFSGVSKTSAHRIVHRVTAAIAGLTREDIKIPSTEAKVTAAQLDFYAIARFPKFISALDCTHVQVQSFGEDDAEVFRIRKGYFSINVQAKCNSGMKFTSIVARWPEAVHGSTIFRNSRLCARLEAGEFRDAFILGDGGYALKNYLITPLNNPVTEAERLFNESQIRTRNKIECTFGIWKRRFPCLATRMRFKVDHVLPVIVATAVLHNKARLATEDLPPDEPRLNGHWDEVLNEDLHNRGNLPVDDGNARRNIIAHFQSLIDQQ